MSTGITSTGYSKTAPTETVVRRVSSGVFRISNAATRSAVTGMFRSIDGNRFSKSGMQVNFTAGCR